MPEAYRMLEAEAVAGGLWANKEFVRRKVALRGVSDPEMNVLCDPQTSGGLLISTTERKAGKMMDLLGSYGVQAARPVGKVLAKGRGNIIVRK
jgi:selenide,water dikinase